MYQALYRKWRPATFADVYGQEHITTTLKNQIAEGKVGHAYLFTGTRGTGKTTCAKILACAVNCERPVGGNPCNECDSCRGIRDGSIMDVAEIDAASNNSVDDIRSLREQAVFTPAEVKKKVYIIDEVHMLSSSAWNALLKTLEEPPAHVIFILATTEIHKVPQTITSRCQRFDFRRISFSDIKRRLEYICKSENIDIESSALDKVVQFAEGSMRDALSLLEKLTGTQGTITAETVASVLGGLNGSTVDDLADCVLREDSAAAISVLKTIYTASGELDLAMSELLLYFRNMLISKMSGDESLIEVSDKVLQKIKSRGEKCSVERLIYICQTLSEFMASLQRSRNKRIDTEIALVRLCTPSLSESPEALIARIQRLENMLALRGTAPMPAVSADPAPAAESQPRPAEIAPESKPEPKPEPKAEPKPVPAKKATEGEIAPLKVWREVLKYLKEEGHSRIYTFVKDAKADIDGGRFLIHTDNFVTADIINNKDGGKIIKSAVETVLGKPLAVEAVLGGKASEDDPFTELHNTINRQ